MGPTNSFAQMASSNTFVYLATAWTRKNKPLMRSFNASDSYRLAVNSSSKPALITPEALRNEH